MNKMGLLLQSIRTEDYIMNSKDKSGGEADLWVVVLIKQEVLMIIMKCV